MRAASFVVGVLTTPALAASPLTLSAVYGTQDACALYADAGAVAAIHDYAGSLDSADFLLVSEDEVIGDEWTCHPISVDGQSVSMACAGEGEEFAVTAMVVENLKTRTLVYSEEDAGEITLQACD